MVLFSGKKWPRRTLAVYLMLAIMGTFIFSMVENLDFPEMDKDQTVSGGFFTSIEYTIDWLIEDITIISKAGGHSFSPLRNGTLRMFMLFSIQTVGIFLVQLLLKKIKIDNSSILKNTIPLKLRI
jgi:hypothetical protein